MSVSSTTSRVDWVRGRSVGFAVWTTGKQQVLESYRKSYWTGPRTAPRRSWKCMMVWCSIKHAVWKIIIIIIIKWNNSCLPVQSFRLCYAVRRRAVVLMDEQSKFSSRPDENTVCWPRIKYLDGSDGDARAFLWICPSTRSSTGRLSERRMFAQKCCWHWLRWCMRKLWWKLRRTEIDCVDLVLLGELIIDYQMGPFTSLEMIEIIAWPWNPEE